MHEGPQQWDHAAAQPSPALLRPPAPGWLLALHGALGTSCTGICSTYTYLDMAGGLLPMRPHRQTAVLARLAAAASPVPGSQAVCVGAEGQRVFDSGFTVTEVQKLQMVTR